MPEINKKTLEYLAGLGKLELKKGSEEKLLHDLQGILSHFEELNEVDTDNIEPLAGGTIHTNIFREDELKENPDYEKTQEKIIKAFPEEEKGFLKVPAVFDSED